MNNAGWHTDDIATQFNYASIIELIPNATAKSNIASMPLALTALLGEPTFYHQQ